MKKNKPTKALPFHCPLFLPLAPSFFFQNPPLPCPLNSQTKSKGLFGRGFEDQVYILIYIWYF